MTIEDFLASDSLRNYILGTATAEETEQVKKTLNSSPKVREAVAKTFFGPGQAVWTETPDLYKRGIEDLIEGRSPLSGLGTDPGSGIFGKAEASGGKTRYLQVQPYWRWLFLVLFICSKIFLLGTIYFYLKFKDAEFENMKLKYQLKWEGGKKTA